MGLLWIIDPYNLTLSAGVTCAFQLLGLLIAVSTDRSDFIFDLFGALNFVLVAVLTLSLGGIVGLRQVYLSVFIILSRAWLGAFLAWRVSTRGGDTRIGGMGKNIIFVATTWVLQAVWIFLLLVPVTLVNGASYYQKPVGGLLSDLTFWDLLGFSLMCGGLVLEVSADLLKVSFRANRDNANFFCTLGVWQLSRHPNFFGEIVFWWGVWFSAVPVLWQLGWLSLLSLCSPLWTMVLLIFVSGLPFAEGRFLARFYQNGQGEAWEEYRRVTPPLCLIPCGLYAYIPAPFKLACCCEFPWLEYHDAEIAPETVESEENSEDSAEANPC